MACNIITTELEVLPIEYKPQCSVNLIIMQRGGNGSSGEERCFFFNHADGMEKEIE